MHEIGGIVKRSVSSIVYIYRGLTTYLSDVCSSVSKLDSAEEKKPVKRSYQKIQEEEDDEDDDYRSHISPCNTDISATQLVGSQHCT